MEIDIEGLQIYGTEIQSQLVVLSALSGTRNWVFTEELSLLTGYERRKLLRNITYLNEDFKKLGYQKMWIGQEKYKGFRLHRENEYDIERFLIDRIKNTVEFKFVFGIYTETIKSLTQFSLDNHISESSAYRILTRFRSTLEKYDIKVSRGDYHLVGNEIKIRTFFDMFTWLVFRGEEQIYSSITDDKIRQFTDEIEVFFKIKLNPIKRKKLENTLENTLFRNQKNRKIILNAKFLNFLEGNQLFQNFCKALGPFLVNQEGVEGDLGYLFLTLLSQDIYYSNKEIQDEIMFYHLENQTEIYDSYCCIKTALDINQVSNQIQERLDKYLIATHTRAYFFDGLGETINGYIYWKKINKKFPELVKKLKTTIHLLKKSTGNIIFTNEQFLIMRYMTVIPIVFSPAKYEEPISILLVTDLGDLEDEKIVEELTKSFLNEYNLKIMSSPDLNQTFDFLLANTSVSAEYLHKITNMRLFFSDTLTKKDYYEIDLICKNISIEKSIHKSKG